MTEQRSETPKQKILDYAEEIIMSAGFNTNSAGPINWKCAASRGSYKSPFHFGYPLRWDLVLQDIKEDWPALFTEHSPHPRPCGQAVRGAVEVD